MIVYYCLPLFTFGIRLKIYSYVIRKNILLKIKFKHMRTIDHDFHFPIMQEMMGPIKKPINREESRAMSSEAIRLFAPLYEVEKTFLEEIINSWEEETEYSDIYNKCLREFILELERTLRRVKPVYFVVFPHYFSDKYRPEEFNSKNRLFLSVLSLFLKKYIKSILFKLYKRSV